MFIKSIMYYALKYENVSACHCFIIVIQKWTTFVIDAESVKNEVNIWIIIGAVLGAVVLLIIVGIILWRVCITNHFIYGRIII